MKREGRPSYLVIEGNIGSGKTTLSKMIAETWNARLVLEEFKDNPFLPKFYQNPDDHAFALELSFLAERYQQKRTELNRSDMFQPSIVSDYSFTKSLVFAKANLDEDEFQLYRTLFNIIHGRLPKPDLLLYLHCSAKKSLLQIAERGRSYEQSITEDYLERITQGYMQHFKQNRQSTVVILHTDHLDFVKHESDFQSIVNVIQAPYPSGIHIIDKI